LTDLSILNHRRPHASNAVSDSSTLMVGGLCLVGRLQWFSIVGEDLGADDVFVPVRLTVSHNRLDSSERRAPFDEDLLVQRKGLCGPKGAPMPGDPQKAHLLAAPASPLDLPVNARNPVGG